MEPAEPFISTRHGSRWRRPAPTPRRIFLWHRDNQRCRYCKRKTRRPEATLEIQDGITSTVDHMQPQSRGGAKSSLDNLCNACRDCNELKGILTVEEFTAAVAFAELADIDAIRSRGDHWFPIYRHPLIRAHLEAMFPEIVLPGSMTEV